MILPFIKQTWEDRIKRKGREHNLARYGFDHKAVLSPFSQWTMELKKPQTSRLTVGFCSVPRTGMLQYFSLRVQLLISQTFPMALPARSRRHRTPEGSSCTRADPARSSSQEQLQPAHSPWHGCNAPQETSPKAAGSRETREQTAGSPEPHFHRKQGWRWHGSIYSI